ncbi:MAG: preprotein translocase subunit SecG [Desulfobacteraceae bacterium]|nr:MAG: preprotein translocase subunit SecG [Desulfobacteraceae bacterium]
MTILLIIIHVIVCIALIMIVLLQTGKGADIGAVFGGGSSSTLFGSTGASTFLSKATTVAAVVFMLTSLSLAYIAGQRPTASVVTDTVPAVESKAPEPASAPAPVAPETKPEAPAAPK